MPASLCDMYAMICDVHTLTKLKVSHKDKQSSCTHVITEIVKEPGDTTLCYILSTALLLAVGMTNILLMSG
jgi:hypothetical protein